MKDNIVVNGYIGTWYVIDECTYNGNKYYQLESEQDGDETPWIIVNESFHIVKDKYGYNIDGYDEGIQKAIDIINKANEEIIENSKGSDKE